MTSMGLLGVVCLLLIRRLEAQPVTYDQRQEGKVNVQVDVKDLQIVALVGSDMLDDFSYDYAYDYADFTVKPSSKPSTAKPTTAKPLTTAILAETSSTSASPSSSTALDSSTTKAPEEAVIKDSTLSPITTSTEEPIIKNGTLSPIAKAPEEPIIKNNTLLSITKSPEDPLDQNSTLIPATNNSTPAEIKIAETTTIANVSKADQDDGTSSTTKLQAESTTTTTTTTSASTSDAQIPSRRLQPLGTAEPRKRCPVGFQMRSGRCFKRRHSLLSPRLALMKLAPALLSKSQLFSGHLSTNGGSS